MTLRCVDVCLLGLLAVSVGACSDSPGPDARGASHVGPTTALCGPGPYNIPSEGTPTSDRVAGTRLIDGKGGDVDCSVRGGTGSYQITASLDDDASRSSFFIDGTVEGVDGEAYSGTSASVGFYDADSGNILSQTCTIEISPRQEIGKGKVWGDFSCVNSTKEATPGFSCNFEGSFIFENCD